MSIRFSTRTCVGCLCMFAFFLIFMYYMNDVPIYTSPSWPGERSEPPFVVYKVPPKDFNGKTVVITGGAGFIGSQLGYHLHNKGYKVILIDNLEFGYKDNLVIDGEKFGTFIKGDILDIRIREYITGATYMFHFAALSALPVCQNNPQKAIEVNVGGTAAMLEASRLIGVKRFLFASTSAVYEDNSEAVLTEDIPVSPHLIYSLSKYQSELLVNSMAMTYGLDVVILRFFNVYGPHQDFRRQSPPFTSYIIRELINNRAPILHGNGQQKRDYIFLSDLLSLVTIAMTKPEAKGQTFNVNSGKSYSVNEMYDMVRKSLGSTIKPIYRDPENFWKAYPEMFRGSMPIKTSILAKEVNKEVLGSKNKSESLLGWRPEVSMEKGFEIMVKYIKEKQAAGIGTDASNVAWK